MLVEWLVIAVLLTGAGLLFVLGRMAIGVRLVALGCLAVGLTGIFWWQQQLEKRLVSRSGLNAPRIGRPNEFTGATACRACHPDQYASWHRSFHRTMTQIPSEESVRGDFRDVALELDGEMHRLHRREGEFWVEMVDPDWTIQHAPPEPEVHHDSPPASGQTLPPRGEHRITLLTGSHHMQAYWVDNQHGNREYNFPFVYLFEQERWVPRRSVFLKNPDVRRWIQVWNVGCIDCHSTAGEPRRRRDGVSFDTRVAELGIACEACHGSAEKHVRLNSDPLRRYALHFRGEGDNSIVNPARLNAKRASEVCGRCHSIHSARDGQRWLRNGESFRPGEDLEARLRILRHMDSPEEQRSSFWDDDMVRVSGREYNGLIRTPCFQKGNMSCLSCHSMHQSSPTNQLARGMESNAACLQCHQDFAANLERHTHHPAGSTGSLCYNCHMPYTTYGLLKALRSHQISNPTVRESLQVGRPNACNLCHLDKSLDWTARQLTAWYRSPQDEMSPEEKTVAASVLWVLKGDAGQRALIAWHMGWGPAREISGESWLAPYLAILLDDPYSAVRYIAGRSLKRLPGYNNFSCDFLSPTDERHKTSERAREIWQGAGKKVPDAALLLTEEGRLQQDTVNALLQTRNNRVLELDE